MEATKSCLPSPFPSISSQQSLFSWRRNGGLRVTRAKLSEPNARRANLSAKKKERILVPSYSKIGRGNMVFHISEFLNHPSGIEAVLNTRALHSIESLDCNLYRCVLPQIQLLNFEVAPVLDLQVTSTKEDCTVEMLSCKFEGSELMENQNDRFAASMRNHITWATIDSESFLDVDVKLNITLEIYTYPFTFLPESAVEGPGNLYL
ncbi:OLC1v1005218C9 [Oldenlandia corymbosa var. corymbosa]|uniref:OLC1v1005218C9 n=1 Tax=Oldenlandia corymbosa var. corymbosa TaxID=529605 RepID=A0AAV1DHJ3_OLDCO|nr:OLC1v1005218C9 [Oldenlandia corymbosa var. corymbosa]